MLEAARDLYALPPGEFTASRNQLAKSLKAAGDAEAAALIAKLRRPRLAEWALNQLARTQPDLVGRLATAIHAAQQAQSAAIGGDAAGLRSATNELRQVVAATTDAAVKLLGADGGNGEAQRDDLSAIVRDLVSSAEPALLVAGVIGSEAVVAPDELFPGAPDPAPSRLKGATAARPAVSKATTAAAPSTPAPPSPAHQRRLTVVPPPKPNPATAAAQRAMVRAERLRLQQELRAAETAQAKASSAVDDATAELARRKTALKEATAAARAATDALATFDRAD